MIFLLKRYFYLVQLFLKMLCTFIKVILDVEFEFVIRFLFTRLNGTRKLNFQVLEAQNGYFNHPVREILLLNAPERYFLDCWLKLNTALLAFRKSTIFRSAEGFGGSRRLGAGSETAIFERRHISRNVPKIAETLIF